MGVEASSRLPLEPAMISTCDPQSMTADERRLEVASILATGLLRRIRAIQSMPSDSVKTSSPQPQIGLDLSAKTRLTVA